MTKIVYVCTNIAMPGYVKIGMTSKADVEQRLKELSNSTGVPMPFKCLHAAEVDDATKVEDALLKAFDDYRPNKKREFFTIDPQKVIVLLKAMQISDVTPATEEILDRITSPADKFAQTTAIAKAEKQKAKQEWRHSSEAIWQKIEKKAQGVSETTHGTWKKIVLECVAMKDAKRLLEEAMSLPSDIGPAHPQNWASLAKVALKLETWEKMAWDELVSTIGTASIKTALQAIPFPPVTKEQHCQLKEQVEKADIHEGKKTVLQKKLKELETQD